MTEKGNDQGKIYKFSIKKIKKEIINMNNEMKTYIYEKICNTIDKETVKIDEPMSRHTTFRIGGPADIFVDATSIQAIQAVVGICKAEGVPYFILGNGSNLLVGDGGYRGVVIQIYKGLSHIQVNGEKIYAEAGAVLSKVGRAALEQDLTGFEFAAGIPGSLGGAVMMNAGAYGGEMKDVLVSATVLNRDGDVIEIPANKLQLGYRTSILEKNGYIALAATLQLKKGCRASIESKMEELKEQRVTKQPLEYPSAGSTFKRPEGYFAGKLVQDAGLKGFSVGGAQVSEKHSGFVINKGNASAKDVIALMEQVSDKVEQQFGVRLEPEIKRIGEF